MISDQVCELDEAGVLDAVQSWHAEQTDREIRIFVAAARFADLHPPDTRPASTTRGGRALPGMEQPRRLGGAGTPLVLEFAAADFGPRIGRGPYAARMLMADALDVRHRLPRLWQRVRAGEVSVRYARHVAQQTRDLSADAAGLVDAAVVEYADGRLGWSRFEHLVAGQVTAADPDRAAERERAAAAEEFAKVGRSNDHGQKTLYVRTTAAAVVRMDATLAYLADALTVFGDTDALDRRRAKAMLILANPPQALQLLQTLANHRAHRGEPEAPTSPGETVDTLDDPDDGGDDDPAEDADPGDPVAAFLRPFRPYEIRPDTGFALGFDPGSLLPSVTLYLHLYARTDTGDIGPVARWEGEGPVTVEYLRDVLGPACRFVLKPVIDLAGMAPVDGYEVPDRHREAVHLRTPADGFPFATNTDRAQQHEHTRPYVPTDHGGPPGQTGLHNLAPLTQFHHRVKTHGTWQVKQPFPGILIWADQHGHHYLVDHTGTRPLTHSGAGTVADLPDLTIEIHQDAPGLACRYTRRHDASLKDRERSLMP